MFQGDCQIKVIELNRDILSVRSNNIHIGDIYDAGKCTNLKIEAKRKLIKYLKKEKMLTYH